MENEVVSNAETLNAESSTMTEAKQETTVKNPEAVLAKNNELLGKLKSTKTELEDLKEFKKNIELAEKERLGQHKEVIEALRKENSELKEQSLSTKKDFAFSQFKTSFKTLAKDNGCVNPDKLMKLMSAEQIKSVEIGEDLTINRDDLTRLIDTLKEEHSDIGLFKAKGSGISTSANIVGMKQDTATTTKVDYEAELLKGNFI